MRRSPMVLIVATLIGFVMRFGKSSRDRKQGKRSSGWVGVCEAMAQTSRWQVDGRQLCLIAKLLNTIAEDVVERMIRALRERE